MDDDPFNIIALEGLLKNSMNLITLNVHYGIDAAHNGKEAVEKCIENFSR